MREENGNAWSGGSGAVSALDYFRPPRLGWSQLAAWVAITVVLMAARPWVMKLESELEPTVSIVDSWGHGFNVAVYLLRSMMQAAGLVGAVTLLHSWSRGSRGRLQPGHWLVLGQCLKAWVRTLLSSAIAFLVLSGVVGEHLDMAAVYHLTVGFFLGASAVVYLVGMIRCHDGRLWKGLFGTLSVSNAIAAWGQVVIMLRERSPEPTRASSLEEVTWMVASGVFLGAVLLFATALILDFRRRDQRDWLHWLGVAMLIAGPTLLLAEVGLRVVFS
jgi:hypothetical protein